MKLDNGKKTKNVCGCEIKLALLELFLLPKKVVIYNDGYRCMV